MEPSASPTVRKLSQLAAAGQDTQTAPAVPSGQRSPLQVADVAATVTSAARRLVAPAEVITMALEHLELPAKEIKVETFLKTPMVEAVAEVKAQQAKTRLETPAETVARAQNGPHRQERITPEAAEAGRILAAQPVSAVQVEAVTVRQVLALVLPAAQRTQVAAVAEVTAFRPAKQTAVLAS